MFIYLWLYLNFESAGSRYQSAAEAARIMSLAWSSHKADWKNPDRHD
jgi:hypothetical protein